MTVTSLLELEILARRMVLLQYALLRFILWFRSQLLFPFQNACAARRSFCLGNMSCSLQSDGEAGVGERIVGSECSQRARGSYGCLEISGIAQCADQSVMSLDVLWIGIDCFAKGLRGGADIAFSQQIDAGLGETIGMRRAWL